jgi:hypothetical protein
MKLSMKNSIYQSGYSGGGPGLTVRGGRLINNRPDSEMGIVSAANARKEMKRQSKIQMQAEGYARGEQMAEVNKQIRSMGDCCD